MDESLVGAESSRGSSAGFYEPDAAVAFIVTKAGVSSTVASEVLRARDVAVARMKREGSRGSGEQRAQPAEEELLAWAIEVLAADSTVKEAILDFVFADCGIRSEQSLAVLAAEAEYMRTYRMADDETARAFRDWAMRRQYSSSEPNPV